MEIAPQPLPSNDVVQMYCPVIWTRSECSQLVWDKNCVDFGGVVVETLRDDKFGLGGDAP